jgi:L-serine dehydratase
MKKLPSIFNDVIGPVMRGPSSSHTAASWRIARTCLDILNEPLQSALVDFDKNGAWAPNYREQGTCMGIDGGLLGLDIADDRMKNTDELAKEMGISIRYEINSFPTKHANTVRLLLQGESGNKIQVVAVSLGGGAFEIQQINGFKVSIKGDYFEWILFAKESQVSVDELKSLSENGILSVSKLEENLLYSIKSAEKFNTDSPGVLVHPVMPIIAGKESDLPFSTIATLVDYAEKEKLNLGELGLLYEKCLSGLSEEVLLKKWIALLMLLKPALQRV